MGEKHISRHEQHASSEKVVDNEHRERLQKHIAEQAERARQEKSAENLAKIREMAEREAKEAEAVAQTEVPASETGSLLGVQQSLKTTAYKRTLGKIQQKLPPSLRIFSRLIHSPVIDKVSAVSAQTVARPSGILGGSICAFLGSVIVLYYSKHYGFKYNYLMVFIIFAGGYLAGAGLELLVWFFYGRKHHY